MFAQEALAYYKKGITLAEARFHVGRCYDTGIGTAQDMRLALKWYKQVRQQLAEVWLLLHIMHLQVQLEC